MSERYILLVEDNPDDEELTLLSLRKNNLAHDIVVVRDGVEAIEFLFGNGQYAQRDVAHVPTIILLDLKLRSSTAWACSSVCAPTSARARCRSWFSPRRARTPT
jgi:CheY-like chemotaxis protein